MISPLSKENINDQVGRFSTADLENLVVKFPYFHQAHLLLAKKYQQENHPKFDEQLQMAALYTQDRELFYTLFNDIDLTPTIEKTNSASTETEPTPTTIIAAEEIAHTLPTTTVDIEPITTPITNNEETESLAVDTATENSAKEITLPIAEAIHEPLEETEVEEPLVALETTQREIAPEENSALEKVLTEEETSTEIEPSMPHFSLQSSHTFDEWLSAFADSASLIKSIQSHQAAPRTNDEEDETEDELEELIIQNVNSNLLHEKVEEETHYSKGLDRFIEEQVQKRKQQTKNTLQEATIEPVLVTETLAKLYENQKKYVKAISTYELLSLKFPEKKGLFAARIENLKKLL